MKKMFYIMIIFISACSQTKHYIYLEYSPDFAFNSQQIVVIPVKGIEQSILGQQLQVSTENLLRKAGFKVLSLQEYDNLQTFCLLKITSKKEKSIPENCHWKNQPLEAYWYYQIDSSKKTHFSINTLPSGYAYADSYTTTKNYGIYTLIIKQGRTNLIESSLLIDATDTAGTQKIIEDAYKSLLFKGDINTSISCDEEKCRVN